MDTNHYQKARTDLNKAAKAMMRAGESLQARLGNGPFTKQQIVQEARKFSEYGPDSLFPSDYWCNMRICV